MTVLAEKVPPEFWPTIDKIDEGLEQVGSPMEIREKLEKIGVFNPDAVRAILPAWGADGGNGLTDSLREKLENSITRVTTQVGERWEGEAFQRFSADLAQVQILLSQITEPARLTGEQLQELLEAIEANWLEIVGIVLEVAGFVSAAVGAATAAVGGMLLAVAGLILSVVGLILAGLDSIGSRFAAQEETIQRLREQVARLKVGQSGPEDRRPDS